MKVNIVNKSSNPLPSYQTNSAAGLDLFANLNKEIKLESLERVLVKTGLFIELPKGVEAQVRPRSGIALKKGITVLNTPGTIDADYRGEIGVILINLSRKTFSVKNGDRIAQLIISKHETIKWNEVKILNKSQRGSDGFGSTDKPNMK